MAHMIPSEMEEDNRSYGERQVFKALKSLPNEYTVFHSLHWNERSEKNNVKWGEADFAILHRKYGMLVIEVKSGGISCRDGKWEYIRTDDKSRHNMKNPLNQAERSHYRFDEEIRDIFAGEKADDGKDRAYCMVSSAVWFPSISAKDVDGELPIDYHDEIVLYEGALQNPEKYILRAYDFYKGNSVHYNTKLTDNDVKSIVERFAPIFNALPSPEARFWQAEDCFIRFTNQQKFLLDYLDEQRVATIQGPAGTGKTILALEKAKRLQDSGKVLFLCFNKFLRLHLLEIKEDNPQLYGNVDIYNLEKLVCEMLKKNKVEREDIYYVLTNFQYFDWPYRHIVIDEGQDFDAVEIERLSDIALLEDGAFYVFYDKNQLVQVRDELPAWIANAECRMVLSINCRNTFAIADTSGMPVHVKPNVKRALVKGEKPNCYIYTEERKALNQLEKLVRNYCNHGFKCHQICILSMKTEDNSLLTDVAELAGYPICTRREKGKILFTTARKFKGLESDLVVMVDIGEETFLTEEARRLFYVGTSRAKHSLDLFFKGTEEGLAERLTEMTDKKFPTPTISIAMNLKVKSPIMCK